MAERNSFSTITNGTKKFILKIFINVCVLSIIFVYLYYMITFFNINENEINN